MDINSGKEFKTPVEDPNKPNAPQKEHGLFEQVKDKFTAHKAHPGPAVPKDFNVKEEGTKAEREARAAELNK